VQVDREDRGNGEELRRSRLRRAGAALFGAMAALSLILAIAGVWLLANPVVVAGIVDRGDLGPLAGALAWPFGRALAALLRWTAEAAAGVGDPAGPLRGAAAGGWPVRDTALLLLLVLGLRVFWRTEPRRAGGRSGHHAE
jgi:hypothetical protein